MAFYAKITLVSFGWMLACISYCQDLHGLNPSLSNLYRLSEAKSRSISPENFTGEKGKGGMSQLGEGVASEAARDLGRGWKVNPYILIDPGTEFVLGEVEGPGAIQHIWMTALGNWRFSILRFYWDDEDEPSVEVPVGDFFANGYKFKQITSLPVAVNPASAFNSYWVMPFRKKCKVTLENIADHRVRVYYQIDYVLTDVPEDAAYFHAQFRRVNPVPYKKVYTIVDNIKGEGQFVGCYLLWKPSEDDWWGEGEIKFYIDGDKDFPTICGTGTEDYFGGSYGFLTEGPDGVMRYTDYTTPYTGFHVFRPDDRQSYDVTTRFGMYRWHIVDPIRFKKDLKVTIQALGWQSGKRYKPLQEDIASVAYWYQTEPHNRFPDLPKRDFLEINR